MEAQIHDGFYRQVIDSFPEPVCCFYPDGEILTANHEFSGLVQASDPANLVGDNINDLLLPENPVAGSRAVNQRLDQDTARQSRAHLRRQDGSSIPVEINIKRLDGVPTQNPIMLAVIHDISVQKQEESAAMLAEQVFMHSNDGIFITDRNNNILRANRALTRITGFAESEIKGCNPRVFSSGHQDKAFYEKMWSQIKSEGFWQGEIVNRRNNGELYHQLLSISVVRNEQGEVSQHIAIISDITARKVAEERVLWLAHHDTLTGLANRSVLEDRVNSAVRRIRREGSLAALLVLDLDSFKPVNDNYGHAYGDKLLVELAGRLATCVRETDTVARIGGDEFAILLQDISKREYAGEVADKLIDSVRRPFDINGISVTVGVSIGISIIPEHGVKAADLLSCADMAMYRAKQLRQNSYKFHSANT